MVFRNLEEEDIISQEDQRKLHREGSISLKNLVQRKWPKGHFVKRDCMCKGTVTVNSGCITKHQTGRLNTAIYVLTVWRLEI